MKLTLNVTAIILITLGGIWILQGINVMPGSFMTGHLQWAGYGGALMIGGITLLLVVNRKRNRNP